MTAIPRLLNPHVRTECDRLVAAMVGTITTAWSADARWSDVNATLVLHSAGFSLSEILKNLTSVMTLYLAARAVVGRTEGA